MNPSEPSAPADGFFGSGAAALSPPPPPVIGLAHGSRHPDGSAALRSLMAEVARTGGLVAEAAFLDLAEPDLTTVALRLAEAGHRRAVVVPLLFTVAFHATVDVPEALSAASAASGVELLVGDILGTGPEVADLVRTSMAASAVAEDTSVLLYAVGSSSASANEAVHDLATRLSASRPGSVRAAFGTVDPRVAAVLPDLPPPVAVVPLFLSPGLLLKPVAELAARHGWTMAPPLGDLAAPVVLSRWAAVTAAAAAARG